MYQLSPNQTTNKTSVGKKFVNIGCSAILALMVLGTVAGVFAFGFSPTATTVRVSLRAKPWNEGKVHIWHDVRGDSNTTFTDVPESASCTKVNDHVYKIGDGGPPIYYYKLICNGVTGYVEIDQVR